MVPARITGQNDQQFCLEQALDCDPRFAITRAYAPKQSMSAVVALYALVASLEKMLCEVSDETVFQAKWAWWRQELLGRHSQDSHHPITRQLHRTGCMQRWRSADLQHLLEGFERRRDPVAPTDVQQFIMQCEEAGRYPMILELQLGDHAATSQLDEVLTAMAVTGGLFRLLRESSRGTGQSYWWLPMNLLARFGISRGELLAQPDGPGRQALVTKAMDLALGYRDRWEQGLVGSSAQPDEIRRWKLSHRHWLAQSVSMGRCLARLRTLPLSQHRAALCSSRAGDVWAVWRNLKKLSV